MIEKYLQKNQDLYFKIYLGFSLDFKLLEYFLNIIQEIRKILYIIYFIVVKRLILKIFFNFNFQFRYFYIFLSSTNLQGIKLKP